MSRAKWSAMDWYKTSQFFLYLGAWRVARKSAHKE
jgi:hypothetical protein